VQSRACASFAEARKRRKKFTVFVKPSIEPNSFGLRRGGKASVNKQTGSALLLFSRRQEIIEKSIDFSPE